jgi:hypothetical protein
MDRLAVRHVVRLQGRSLALEKRRRRAGSSSLVVPA